VSVGSLCKLSDTQFLFICKVDYNSFQSYYTGEIRNLRGCVAQLWHLCIIADTKSTKSCCWFRVEEIHWILGIERAFRSLLVHYSIQHRIPQKLPGSWSQNHAWNSSDKVPFPFWDRPFQFSTSKSVCFQKSTQHG
jgi:hypothetical protein